MIVFLRRILIVGRLLLLLLPGPGLALRYRGAHDALLVVARRLHQLVVVVVVVGVEMGLATFTTITLVLSLLLYWPGRLRHNC